MMNEEQKTRYYSYLSELDIKTLEHRVKDLELEVQGNGEMAESARLAKYEGREWYGASEEDYEHEYEECLKYLTLNQHMLKFKRALNGNNCTLIKDTMQVLSEYFFLCSVTNEKGEKRLFIYNHSYVLTFAVNEFHAIRRYCDNHQDDF